MKKLFLFIVSLFLSLNCYYGQKLDLTLKSLKTEYLKYEHIDVILNIKNNDTKSITIRNFTDQGQNGYKIHIFNLTGDILNTDEGVRLNLPPALYELNPGEEIEFTLSILHYSKFRDFNERVTKFGYYLEPGELFIKLTYQYEDLSSEDKSSKVKFISNTIDINIIEPTVDDKEGIITDLKEVSRLSSYKVRNYSESIKKALEIIKKYPRHPLTQEAYRYLTPKAQNYYKFDSKYYNKKFSKDFPNTRKGIAFAAKYIEEDEDFKDEIKGTNLYKAAIEYKNRMERRQKIKERHPCNLNYGRKSNDK